MTNKLYVGFSKEIEPPKAGLFIGDNPPNIRLAKVFDPQKHSFNPLRGRERRFAKYCNLC